MPFIGGSQAPHSYIYPLMLSFGFLLHALFVSLVYAVLICRLDALLLRIMYACDAARPRPRLGARMVGRARVRAARRRCGHGWGPFRRSGQSAATAVILLLAPFAGCNQGAPPLRLGHDSQWGPKDLSGAASAVLPSYYVPPHRNAAVSWTRLRLGEALHPGPYTVGGAQSSSSSLPPSRAPPSPPASYVLRPPAASSRIDQEADVCDSMGGIVDGMDLASSAHPRIREGDRSEPLPAWARWSVPVYTLGPSGKIHAQLVPPEQYDDAIAERDHDELWHDDDLQAFLDDIEAEAGLRPISRLAARSAAEEWDLYEMMLRQSGLNIPAVEERGAAYADPDGAVLQASHGDAHVPRPPRERPGHWKPRAGRRQARASARNGNTVIACTPTTADEPPIEELSASVDLVTPPTHDATPAAGCRTTSALGRPTEARQADVEHPVAEARPRDDLPPRHGLGERSGRRRNRGGGRRGGGLVSLFLVNTSGKPQLLAAIEVLRRRRNVGAIMIQEHHCRGDALVDCHSAVKQLGWKLADSEAAVGDGGGSSAGTAIAAPRGIGWAPAANNDRWDWSPALQPGRITAAWLEAGTKCGLLTVSLYLWTGEGLSSRNLRLLEHALVVASRHGSPWIIGADFNVPPDILRAAAARLLERFGAIVKGSGEPTFKPGRGEARELDYFLVDARIADTVETVEVELDVPSKPHKTLRMDIRGKKAAGLITTMRSPKAFPRELPVGCARAPCLPACSQLPEDAPQQLENAWRKVMECAEAELCRRFDAVSPDGKPRDDYIGRAAGPKIIQLPNLPPRCTASLGKVDRKGHALVWFAIRAEEMGALLRKLRLSRGDLGANALSQWRRLHAKMAQPKGLLGDLFDLDPRWRAAVQTLSDLGGELIDVDASTDLEDIIEEYVRQAKTAAHQRAEERRSTAASKWRSWIKAQAAAGGPAIHRYVRRQKEVAERSIGEGEERTSSPQALVDADLRQWQVIWDRLKGIATAPWVNANIDHESPLPKPTVDAVRRAARGFKLWTGVGSDLIPPRAYAWLSDELIECIIDVFMKVERLGRWPEQLMLVLMHLIPKSDGGRRPIGIIPSAIRIWEKLRTQDVQPWRDANDRTYNWATRGKSSESAVWRTTVIDEAARSRGWASGATFLDLAKAFEHIPLQRIWERGLQMKYPLRVLRMVLQVCAFPRRLIYNGALSSSTSTLSAVIAGLTFSTDCLYLIMIEVIDDLVISHPQLDPGLYIDDVKLHRWGVEGTFEADLTQATETCINLLEDRCSLVVSRAKRWMRGKPGKTVAVGSTPTARQRMSTAMRRMGITVAKRTKYLGIDYRPQKAKAGLSEELKKRWSKAARKRTRMRRVGGGVAAGLVRSHLAASARHGITVGGIPSGVLKQVAAAAAEMYGPLGGRSTTARLAVRRGDPRLPLAVRPVQAWATIVWTQALDADMLRDAWLQAQKEVGLSKRPHSAVTGGAGAFVAALSRLHWKSPAHNVIITREGFIMDMSICDVKTIVRAALLDLAAALAAASSVARDIEDLGIAGGHFRKAQWDPDQKQMNMDSVGSDDLQAARLWRGGRYQMIDGHVVPWFEPAAMMVCGIDRPRKQVGAALRSLCSLVEGGWWPQARLHAARLVDDPLCRADGCHGGVCGTTWHRLADCRATEEERKRLLPEWVYRKAVTQKWDPLFYRGVPCMPLMPKPPRDVLRWGPRGQPADGAVATGRVYTDGALRGRMIRMARGGWGIAVLSDDMEIIWECYGTCAEPFPTTVRSELHAVLNALRRAAPPLTIYTDCAEVVRGFALGRRWCTAPAREGADLWRTIWGIACDFTIGQDLTITKVKAHTTQMAVIEGRISEVDRLGNMLADRAAKEGMKLAEAVSPTSAARAALSTALRWYKWVVSYAHRWQSDAETTRRADRLPRAAARRGLPTRPRRDDAHVLWNLSGGKIVCRRCGREAVEKVKLRGLRNSKCNGTATGRMAAEIAGDPKLAMDYFWFEKRALLARGATPIDPLADPDSDRGSAGTTESDEEEGPHQHQHQLHLHHRVAHEHRDAADHHAADERHDEDHHAADDRDAERGAEQADDDDHMSQILHASAGDGDADGSGLPRTARGERLGGEGAGPVLKRRRLDRGQADVPRCKRPRDPGDAQRGQDEAVVYIRRRRLTEKTPPERAGYPYMSAAPPSTTRSLARGTSSMREATARPLATRDTSSRGHSLAVTGRLLWCTRCGCYATHRIGVGLKSQCLGRPRRGQEQRLAHLQRHRHPITGKLLM